MSSRFASEKLRRTVFVSVIFAAVIFASVLLWASFPPSDSQSCVWGGGELAVIARVEGRGGVGGAGTKRERGGRGIEGEQGKRCM